MQDVAGLLQALALRPVIGPGFEGARTAVINAAGMIDAAIGNPGDCVHVDGTAGSCGSTTVAIVFVDNEVPTGALDGSNLTYKLSRTPSPSSSLQFFRNGLLLKPGTDYTLSGSTVSLDASQVPQQGDTLLTSYRSQ